MSFCNLRLLMQLLL